MPNEFTLKDFANKAAFNRARFDEIAVGNWRFPWFIKQCHVKILFVVDGFPNQFLNVTYGQLYFSLSAVLETLSSNPEKWLKFEVTKAHRQTDPLGEADMEGFRFTQPGFNINDYDEVWLFGARGNVNDADRLSDQELAVLSRWMDEKQGGVFATGDHADLGASLCARIPRVRSMRKWTGPDVPQPTGDNRHDTLRKGHDAYYTFNDESDDEPMPIDVTMFPASGWSPFIRYRGPHPVLCGTAGIINVLPDHPHEGEVVVPASLFNTFSFPGYANKPEYPPITGGPPKAREKPVIIARAHVLGDHTASSDLNKGAADAKLFGVIGAYNGHKTGVGRVVVDSTWHHWFDVNLIGRPDPGDPIDPVGPNDPKRKGFLATPAGEAAYAKIQNYFRNVAIWLAPPVRQNCMFFRATWWIVNLYPLVEQLSLRLPVWELGQYTLDAMGRHAGQCMVRTWLIDVINEVWIEKLFPPRPDPCLTCPPFPAFEQIVFGTVVREFLKISYAAREKGVAADEQVFERAMDVGLEAGAELFVEMVGASLRSTAGMLATFKSKAPLIVGRSFGSPDADARPSAAATRRRTARRRARGRK